MNDQKILEYIARTPDARAVQIADMFDVELVDASNALKSLVDVGDLVRTSGMAPNGQPAQLYNLSLTFKRSPEGKAISARAATASDALAAAVAAPVSVCRDEGAQAPAPEIEGSIKQPIQKRQYNRKPAAPAPTRPAAPAPAAFRCGIWSDGSIELRRNSTTICTLMRDEANALCDFLRGTP